MLEVPIKSLTDDEVAQLTKLLSRRPTYGIARPSGKWLARQQEKMEGLSENILEPKNLLQRKVKQITVGARQLLGDLQLATPLAERAVLCSTHKRLNSFVIREIFWLLFLEIGSHLDPLRAWPHKSPTMAMFLTRVDSISALVMSREFFVQRFKAAPHDERFVRVESECEACVLAAVGGNGRCLADLYAATKLRGGHGQSTSAHRRYKTPRLARFVSHWIRSMEDPQTVFAWAEEIMADLGPVQRDIKRNWRHQDKKRSEKASRSKSKSQARHKVSLPRAQDESESMDQRRVAALYGQEGATGPRSVYCGDSLVNERVLGGRASAYYPPPPSGHRTATTNPFADLAGEGAPRSPAPGVERSVYDDSWDHDVAEEMDLEPHERGPGYNAQDTQDRVGRWYSRVGGGNMVPTADSLHPALQPTGSRRPSHHSAVPPSLDPPASSYVGARAAWHDDPPRDPKTPKPAEPSYDDARPPVAASRGDAQTVWTDVTAHTYEPPSRFNAAAREPPVPRVPSRYDDHDGRFPTPDGASTPRLRRHDSGRPPSARSGYRRESNHHRHHHHSHHARSSLPPPSGRSSVVNAAKLGRLDAEEQRKWDRETSGNGDDDDGVDVNDSISCVAPPKSEITTLGGLMRRHERGGR